MPTIVVEKGYIVAEVSIKNNLKKLVELQKIDSEIYDLKKELEQRPQQIEEIKADFEDKKATLKKLEDKLKSIQLDRKDKELSLKTSEDNIVKANSQLSQIKTNKEYTAKLTEIESIKADKSIIEEKILLSMDEGDAIAKEIEKEKQIVTMEEKSYLAKKKEIEDQIKVLEDRIKVLDTQRKQYLPDLDRNILNRYEKVLQHKSGLAIAPILKGTTCGGCFMNITPQMINAIKMSTALVECEMCSRILYLEDQL
jgi:predicted  nucleic acid-binding Zn-ribbon protein